VKTRAQPPKRLNGLLGTGDDNRVKTEEKSSECGRERPEKDANIHDCIERSGRVTRAAKAAVSNPNNKPPNVATIVLRKINELSFTWIS
jgi:hypothetical protein